MSDTDPGVVLTSSRYADTLSGGGGADTLNAGQGPDQLTGGAGGDLFVYAKLPWNAGHITDFTVGADHLNLDKLFIASSYAGADPVADGYLSFRADGAGGTQVYYDTDGPSSNSTIQYLITTLDNVSPTGLTAAQVIDQSYRTADGHPQFQTSGSLDIILSERNLPGGTDPNPAALTQTGRFTLSSPDGVASLTIDGHTVITNGAVSTAPFTTSSGETFQLLHYYPSNGEVAYTLTLNAAASQPDAFYAQHLINMQATDNDGDISNAALVVRINDDQPLARDDTDTVEAGQTATGNMITDASPGDQGDTDNGADKVGADGARITAITNYAGNAGYPINGSTTIQGYYGTLTFHETGEYSFTAKADAPAGAQELFTYTLRDGDDDTSQAKLTITIGQPSGPPSSDGGRNVYGAFAGDTLTGGAGSDTLHASQGADQLTGGDGGDYFKFDALPWSSGHITDFVVGTDKLDLSGIMAASNYSGTDPVADGYLSFHALSNGSTEVYWDSDGPASGNPWPIRITTLDHVPSTGLTAATVLAPSTSTGGGSGGTGGGGGSTEGQTLNSAGYATTLTGGGGADTLNAGQGPDTLTGGGGADHFVFAQTPWNAGHITDYTPGQDVIDLRGLFAGSGYTGSDPFGDGYLFLQAGAGGTQVLFDSDGPGGTNPYHFVITTLDGLSPTQVNHSDFLFH